VTSIIQTPSIGSNYLDRDAEYCATLEKADALKRELHAAQVAGNQQERLRLEAEYRAALDTVNILKEIEARDWMRGFRFTRELYHPQLRFLLEDLIEELDRLKDIERRVGLVEDAVVDLKEGVIA
jgi:hypothetical protein